MRRQQLILIGLAAATLLAIESTATARVCEPDDEFCTEPTVDAGGGGLTPGGVVGIDEPCWSPELGDRCNTPPPPCEDSAPSPFRFSLDPEGSQPAGQELFVLNGRTPQDSCVYIQGVTQTGYYRLFDGLLAESCNDQRDETAFVTLHNTCNPQGWAVEANVGNRFVLLDADNGARCEADAECGDGMVCSEPKSTQGRCCVPDRPAFIGTFLLVAGEPNKLCLHHFCPVWLAAQQSGENLGFVTNDCGDPGGANSVHLQLTDSFVGCDDDTMLKPCNWGCEAGACLPDPCAAANCPGFCKDGVCLGHNPCASMACVHGCKNGRCLQPPSAPGPDTDGDGYPQAADCDDSSAAVSPRAPETCANGIDDDCDGLVDEPEDCPETTLDGRASADMSTSTQPPGASAASGNAGCGCATGRTAARPDLLGLCLLLLAGLCRARQRRSQCVSTNR